MGATSLHGTGRHVPLGCQHTQVDRRSSQVPFFAPLSHRVNDLNAGNFGVCCFWLSRSGRRLRVKTSRRGVTQTFWANTTHNPSRADTFCLHHHLSRSAETGKSLLGFVVGFFLGGIFTLLASSPFQIERSFCSVLPSRLQAIMFPSPSNIKLNLSQKKTLFR